MAKLSVTVGTSYGNVVGTINYTTSTSNGVHTLTIQSFEWSPSSTGNASYASGTASLTFGGTTVDIHPSSQYVDTISFFHTNSSPIAINVSVQTTMTHSAQTKALKLTLSNVCYYLYSGGSWYPSNSVSSSSSSANISIAARPSYAVTYNANGGSGAPSQQTKWYGESLTLSSSAPTRANYVFKNWNTAANGSGTSYAKGATYTGNAALTLYAQWYAPYTVSYDANGGSGAPASQVKVYNTALTLSGTKPTRAGYVFRRWNTNTSDTGTAYNPSARYETNANLSLYAIWNPIITYDANGGTGAPAAQTKTFGTNLTLQSGTPTRTGYTFNGWNTKADGSGTNYSAGGTYTSNTAATLYAKWKKNPAAPTISSLTVVRSNSSGTATNTGTYCKVTAAWSIDTTNVSGNTATVTGKIKPQGGSATTFTFSSGASGTSGTAVAIVANCDTDTQYEITVTVTDTRTSTSRSAIMTSAFFILDLDVGGNGMGIGSAAPASGLEVGWAAQFDKAVTMLAGLAITGNLSVTGNITAPQLTVNSYTSDIVTAASGWTVSAQSAKVYGKVVMVQCALKPSAATAAGSRTIGNIAASYRPSLLQGFADSSGMGTIATGGGITYRNVVDLTTSSTVYVAAAYLKA